MALKGKNKVSKWSSRATGMKKHRSSGVAHNQSISIMRNREAQKEQEEMERLRKQRKGKMFDRVTDLFK